MADHNDVLGRMGDDELMDGLRKVALPIVTELYRRGFAVSISPRADAPEFVFVKNSESESGVVSPFRA